MFKILSVKEYNELIETIETQGNYINNLIESNASIRERVEKIEEDLNPPKYFGGAK